MAQGAVKPRKSTAPKKCVFHAPTFESYSHTLQQAHRSPTRHARHQTQEGEPDLAEQDQEGGNLAADGEDGEVAGAEGRAFGGVEGREERGEDWWGEEEEGGE